MTRGEGGGHWGHVVHDIMFVGKQSKLFKERGEREKREGGISVKSSSLYNSAALFQNFMRNSKFLT